MFLWLLLVVIVTLLIWKSMMQDIKVSSQHEVADKPISFQFVLMKRSHSNVGNEFLKTK
jgi:hypothetical protein